MINCVYFEKNADKNGIYILKLLIFKVSIEVNYQHLGDKRMEVLFNRTLSPRKIMSDKSEMVHLFWYKRGTPKTSADRPNHFVPLLELPQPKRKPFFQFIPKKVAKTSDASMKCSEITNYFQVGNKSGMYRYCRLFKNHKFSL